MTPRPPRRLLDDEDRQAVEALRWLIAHGYLVEEFSDPGLRYVVAQVDADVWPTD